MFRIFSHLLILLRTDEILCPTFKFGIKSFVLPIKFEQEYSKPHDLMSKSE